MATALQIQELRALVNEPDATNYTDETLGTRIDALLGDITALASTIWREKAARFATLIDVQEGSSNRKMSQLYQQALTMASSFGGSSLELSGRRPARTRPIERM